MERPCQDHRTTYRCLQLVFACISVWVISLGPNANALNIDVADSPTSNLALTLRAIEAAKQSLFINAYELNSPEIIDAICKQIRKGIHTEIILEGEPVGGFSQKAQDARDMIIRAMEESSSQAVHRFFLMTSENKKRIRRFKFDHAKYILVDESHTLIGSENYTRTGNPLPSGAKGNRGWQTFVHDEFLTKQLLKVFEADKDLSHGDVIQLVEPAKYASKLFGFSTDFSFNFNSAQFQKSISNWAMANLPVPLTADHVEHLTSPNTSLAGIVAFIEAAKETLDLELMSFNSRWGTTGKESPLLDAIVSAARRGVKVRVLLNDESVFGGDRISSFASGGGTTNLKTVAKINQLASDEELDLEAATADIEAMGITYIHNKGALSDGFKTLVSSINWNQNSVERNRETAVSITSNAIHSHYLKLFDRDWNLSRPANRYSR